MPSDDELDRLRTAIDALNARLVDALHERTRLVRQVAAWKRTHGVPAVDPQREAAMLAAVTRDLPADGCPRADLEAVFAAVFAAARRLAREIAG